ncbi:MFS transporter [Streptomyces rimosus subsp. pseudoverticillatus]|uniref:MFS transporter n=1 Tax=Streptomyces rimosus TaxID=1927 RepID=UPI0006B2784A|nr:MFS transporter [Streptomyces rimosus]KOT86965.1 MFS transporter [Streptomyces rimosus subsp. pseudoverticillatus]
MTYTRPPADSGYDVLEADADRAHAAPSPWRALSVVLIGIFVAVLDTFIVLVATPAIQRDLHASDADVQLVLAGYQLAYAVALITGARLGDLIGRKRCFLIGMALFTLASVACAAAPGAGALIGARLVQGLGAAVMSPQVFSTIQVLLPPERRARAFGVLGAVIGTAGVAGQLLGGVLVSADLFGTSWRPIFWVNVPVGLLTLALAAVLVPESRAPEARRLDLAGAAVLTPALFLLVVPLVEGREAGWPLWTWLSLALGALALVAFARVERRVEARGGSPLVRLRLLRSRAFAVGMVLVLLTYFGINSFFLVLSVTLQDGLGLGTLAAGAFYLPFAAAFFAGSLAAGRLARYGRRLLQAGALVLALGHAAAIAVVLQAGSALTAWALAVPLLVIGAGTGVLVTPLLNAVLARVRPAEIGMASGILSTGQQVGGSVGVAAIGVIFYGTLGDAAHHDPSAYGPALAAALAFCLALAVAVSVLLRALPQPPGAGQ